MSHRTCKHCGGPIVKLAASDRDWIHTETGNGACAMPRLRAEPEPQLAGHTTDDHTSYIASGPSYAEEDHEHEHEHDDLTEGLNQLDFKLVSHDHDSRYRTHAEALSDLLDHFETHHKPSPTEVKRRKVVKGWATGILLGALAGPPIAALLPWELWVQPPLWVALVLLYLWGFLLSAAVAVVVTGGRYPEGLAESWVGPYYGRLREAEPDPEPTAEERVEQLTEVLQRLASSEAMGPLPFTVRRDTNEGAELSARLQYAREQLGDQWPPWETDDDG